MRNPRERLIWALLAPLAAGICGCPVVTWVLLQLEKEKKVDAVFKPPKDKKVFVFVDDLRYPVSYEPIKAELTDRLNRLLMEHKIAAETVPYERLADLIAATPDFNKPLAVTEVGKKIGCDLVLHVEITRFLLKETEETPLWQGYLATSVRWVDPNGRLWPKDRPKTEGYPVSPVELPPVENPSPTYGTEVAKTLAEQMADRIVELFRDHKPSGKPVKE